MASVSFSFGPDLLIIVIDN